MDFKKHKYLIALTHFPKFGPVRLKKLKSYFSSFETAFNSTSSELKRAGIEEKVANEFVAMRSSINIDKITSVMNKEGMTVITLDDKNYPKLLKEIYDPPALLYIKGKFDPVDEFALAVVGTRKFSPYGKQVTAAVVKRLAQNKLTIVSGMALGIDTFAHQASLEMGGRTIAVLGSGLDKASIYPSANRYLADKIVASGGAVITEFPLGTPPLKHNFPQRNRIISGLALGTLVVEAGDKSGALITARSALDQNREVFAVPGNIYSSTSLGPNKLIKDGARPITAAVEILETLDLNQVTQYIDSKKIIPETKEEALLLNHLTLEPQHVDELIRLTNLNASHIIATLTMMEMKGMVKNLGNMNYVLAR